MDPAELNGDDFIRKKELNRLSLTTFFFKNLDLINFCDRLIPKTKRHFISTGECFMALALAGVSRRRRALYKIFSFMQEIPVKEFFGRDIPLDNFNDDVLGRFLDEIQLFGPDEFFAAAAYHIFAKIPELLSVAHRKPINPELFEKPSAVGDPDIVVDKILQLKKDGFDFSKKLSAAILNPVNGVPSLMLPAGTSLDETQKIIRFVTVFKEKLLSGLESGDPRYLTGDETFFLPKIINHSGDRWICRMPESVKKEIDFKDTDEKMERRDGKTWYYPVILKSRLNGVLRHMVLCSADILKPGREKKFKTNLKDALFKIRTDFKKQLMKTPFSSEEDAREAAHEWAKRHPLAKFDELTVEIKNEDHGAKFGRRKIYVHQYKQFFLDARISASPEFAQSMKNKFGSYLLATNDLKLKPEEIVHIFNMRRSGAKIFSYLKDDSLTISKGSFKKPERSQAFYSLVGVFLLFYSVTDILLSQKLKNSA
ncbi:MAG: DUF4277 domain-containing protein [Deltaproteobacteria bacterium]|jgi:hypothetical protein|nr:DUF4277 domain-containing protein [Deltaproteobacteria bacterium]